MIAWLSVARSRPLGAVIRIDVSFDIAGRSVVPKPVLKNLSYKFFLVYGVKDHARCDSEMPTAGRNFAPVDLHFLIILIGVSWVN